MIKQLESPAIKLATVAAEATLFTLIIVTNSNTVREAFWKSITFVCAVGFALQLMPV